MIATKLLLTKIIGPALLLVVGVVGGMSLQQKAFTHPVEIPACPACNCPENAVSIQPFEVEKIKNLKAFTYSPEFTGSINVAGVDSTAIKRYIDQAVISAFEKHVHAIDETKKKKRR